MIRTKRFFILVLAMVFVFAFATTASATTVQWESLGVKYSANALRANQGGCVAIFSNTRQYHDYNLNGIATELVAQNSYSVTKGLRWSPTPVYAKWVQQAVRGEGLCISTTLSVDAGRRVTVPATAESGEYVIAAFYYTYDGSWSVFNKSDTPNVVVEYGYFYDAPLITEYFIDYYKVR